MDSSILVCALVFAAIVLPVLFWRRDGSDSSVRTGKPIRKTALPGLFQILWGPAVALEKSVGVPLAVLQPGGRKECERLILASSQPLSYEILCALQFLTLLVFMAVGAVVLLLPPVPAGYGVGIVVIAAFFGWQYPRTALRQFVEQRQAELTRALPFAIDLIGSAMRAGLEFGAALRYFVTLGTGGPLEEEFSHVLQQVELGKTRSEALAEMARRVQVEAFTSFVGVVSYGTEIGASIVETLKIHGEDLRRARFNLAERKAARAPSLMILPLAAFIMPAVFIIVITPIVMRMRAMGIGAH